MCFPVEISFEVEVVKSPIPISDEMKVASWSKWNIDIGTWWRGMQYQKAAIWRD